MARGFLLRIWRLRRAVCARRSAQESALPGIRESSSCQPQRDLIYRSKRKTVNRGRAQGAPAISLNHADLSNSFPKTSSARFTSSRCNGNETPPIHRCGHVPPQSSLRRTVSMPAASRTILAMSASKWLRKVRKMTISDWLMVLVLHSDTGDSDRDRDNPQSRDSLHYRAEPGLVRHSRFLKKTSQGSELFSESAFHQDQRRPISLLRRQPKNIVPGEGATFEDGVQRCLDRTDRRLRESRLHALYLGGPDECAG